MPFTITPFCAKDPVQMSISEWALYLNIYPYYWEAADFLESYFLIEKTADILNEMEHAQAARIYHSFSSVYQEEIWPYLDDELKAYLSLSALSVCLAKDGALGKRAMK